MQALPKLGYTIKALPDRIEAHPSKHTHTLIWLHGLGVLVENSIEVLCGKKQIAPVTMRYVFLQANKMPVTIMNGQICNAWFDFFTMDVLSKNNLNFQQLQESAKRIFTIIDDEAKILLNDYSKIYIGGSSQGGVMSLYVGLNFKNKIAGIIDVIGFLSQIINLAEHIDKVNLPILITHGTKDSVVPYGSAMKSYEPFKENNFTNVTIITHKEGVHENSQEQIEDVFQYLNSKINKMKSILIFKDGKVECKEIDKPIAAEGHVIVRVYAAPIFPADDALLKGVFKANFSDPSVDYDCAGFDGSGIVVEVGKGVPSNIIGKKVGFSRMFRSDKFFGTYTQYARVNFDKLIILDDSVDLLECSGLFVNPLTVIGLLEEAKKRNCDSIISTAACSSLGKMLLKEGIKRKLNIICVVRKKEQISVLQKLGAQYVINSSETDFKETLKSLSYKLNAKFACDAINGEMVGILASVMPPTSTIMVYGMLGGPLQNKEQIEKNYPQISHSFYMLMKSDFFTNHSKYLSVMKDIAEDLKTEKIYKIETKATYKLENFKEAFMNYKALASEGKTIFLPND